MHACAQSIFPFSPSTFGGDIHIIITSVNRARVARSKAEPESLARFYCTLDEIAPADKHTEAFERIIRTSRSDSANT